MCKSNYFSIAAAALLSLTSCQALIKEDHINCTAPVTVRVQDFAVSMEEFPGTKATSAVASYDGVKEITLAFYSGTTEAYKVTQRRGRLEEGETFGVFNCTLPMGSYTMVVLGYGMGQNNEDVLTLTSPTQAEYTEGRVRETFAATQAVNINSTEAVDISATLGRIVAKVNITSTDNRPAIVAAIRATFSAGGKAFNPTTGLSTVNSGFRNTVVLQNAPGGTSGIVSYLFLATIDEVTDNDCEGLYLFLSIFGSAFTGDLTHEEAAVSGFL